MRNTMLIAAGLLAVSAGTAVGQGNKSPASAPAAAATGQWESAQGGALPGGAQPTGYEGGGFLFSCRASAEGGVHPGKIRPGFSGCFVPLGGRETSIRAYEVLMPSPGQTWVVARDGEIPQGAVASGRTREGQPLYICRAAAPEGQGAALQPGKTGAGLRGCNVGVGGREVTQPMYEVLVQR